MRSETPEPGREGVGSLEGMDEAWLAALRHAELVAESGHAVTDESYAELARHWSEGEIIELTMVAGLFSYFNRFNNALRVEVTR